MYTKQLRWEIKPLLMAYSLSNICTKNYWNRATTIKVIVGGWLVYFFGNTVIRP